MPALWKLPGKTEAETARIDAVFRQDSKNDAHVHVGIRDHQRRRSDDP